MTIEEKQKAINALEISVPVIALTDEEFSDYRLALHKIKDWLEKEPKTESVTEFADRCRECGKRYVKRQTGHWIKQILGYKCSNCTLCTNEMGSLTYRYCPNCGCRMVDPQESEDKDEDTN